MLCALVCRAYVYNSYYKKCYPKYAASKPSTCEECYGSNEFELVRSSLFISFALMSCWLDNKVILRTCL